MKRIRSIISIICIIISSIIICTVVTIGISKYKEEDPEKKSVLVTARNQYHIFVLSYVDSCEESSIDDYLNANSIEGFYYITNTYICLIYDGIEVVEKSFENTDSVSNGEILVLGSDYTFKNGKEKIKIPKGSRFGKIPKESEVPSLCVENVN